VGTAFKPALGELYKKHSVCTKIRLFKIQNSALALGVLRVLFLGNDPCLSRRLVPPPLAGIIQRHRRASRNYQPLSPTLLWCTKAP